MVGLLITEKPKLDLSLALRRQTMFLPVEDGGGGYFKCPRHCRGVSAEMVIYDLLNIHLHALSVANAQL